LFWEATSESRAKLTVYHDRIRELEEALCLAHSLVSHETHPLLTEELLRIKDGGRSRSSREDDILDDTTSHVEAELDVEKSLERLGSLTLSDSGKSRFYGHAANGWVSHAVHISEIYE
jgi:hypothetical protein